MGKGGRPLKLFFGPKIGLAWFFLTLFTPADTNTDFLALSMRNGQIANPFARMIVREVAKKMQLPVPKKAKEKNVHPSMVVPSAAGANQLGPLFCNHPYGPTSLRANGHRGTREEGGPPARKAKRPKTDKDECR